MKRSIYITRDYSGWYREQIRKESYEKFKESPSKNKAYTIYSDEKKFDENKEKNQFLV